MFKLPHISKATDLNEEEYRAYYCKNDVNQSRLAMLLFAVPIAGFLFNDYLFFGLSLEFFGLAALRIVLLSVTALEIFYVARVKSHRSYDLTLFSASAVILVGGGIINALRPANFVIQATITIISVFVLYLVIPFRFLYQAILSSAATIGEAVIVLSILKPTEPTIAFTLIFSMFFANLIAAASSWQMHSYRRKAFRESIEHKVTQNALENQTLHLEKLVAERTEKLMRAERFAAIGETAGMVGHDLRNPLTAIKNAAYLIRKKQGNLMSESGNEMLSVIDKAVEQANNIVADLLDYSREIHLDRKEHSPRTLIENVLTSINIPNSVKVINRTQSEPSIWVDSDKMERVFVNLIKNAVEAMPDGGNLEIDSTDNSENLTLTFADSGQGMSEDVLAKVFTPLFTTKAKGMGLGLPICKRILEAHSGTISVQSTIGKGTTFTIVLPKIKSSV